MDPLAEARAVALMLQNRNGFVHVYSDGSANWSTVAPDPGAWPFPEDCPEAISVRKLTYRQARNEFRNAIKRLRTRGVLDMG
jgi:hypothetical protein